MSTEQVLLGIGLTLALAVGCQVVARRLHVPALILLLPVGFTAGALTDIVHPDELVGIAFQPLVSLSVALVLYDAGLGLDLRTLTGPTRRVVGRLIGLGILVTIALGTLAGSMFLGLSEPAAVMLATILVISGPTVVGPLLQFVRPVPRLQRILTWEGSLVDPIGAILGALVFHTVMASRAPGLGAQVAQFVLSTGVGLLGAVVGSVVLWVLLSRLRLDEELGTAAQLAVVALVAATCDVLKDDAGLIAAIGMGLVLANRPEFDVPARRPFFETLVQLILGVLFLSISATVSPESVQDVLLPALGLAAVLVLVARPLVAFLATVGAGLSPGERGFVGWMAPRGIVAAATASTFSAGLVAEGVPGAERILPATFLVIVVTVVLYGLTSEPVGRLLGVVRAARTRPLLVGDEDWMLDLALTLRAGGVEPVCWAGVEEQRARIRDAGLELAPGELLAAATGRGAQLEGITAVLLLTGDDDFNALAAVVLGAGVDGPVYRLRPARHDQGVVAPFLAGRTLFPPTLDRDVLAHRFALGARLALRSPEEAVPGGGIPEGTETLFVIRSDGRLVPTGENGAPATEAGDRSVVLGPVVPRAAGAEPALGPAGATGEPA